MSIFTVLSSFIEHRVNDTSTGTSNRKWVTVFILLNILNAANFALTLSMRSVKARRAKTNTKAAPAEKLEAHPRNFRE